MSIVLKVEDLKTSSHQTGLNINFERRGLYCITGLAGKGKSKLVLTLAGVERPISGTVYLNQHNLAALKEKDWLQTRRDVAVVMSGANLVSHLTVLQNVMLPLTYHNLATAEQAMESAKSMLSWLETKLAIAIPDNVLPSGLSEAQLRLISLARALMLEPKILFVDHPFSNLDAATKTKFAKFYSQLVDHEGLCVVLASKELTTLEALAQNSDLLKKFIFVADQDILCFDCWRDLLNSDNKELEDFRSLHALVTAIN